MREEMRPAVAAGAGAGTERALWLDRLGRRALTARLQRLTAGRLAIQEGPLSVRYGPPPEAAASFEATIAVHCPRFYVRAAFGGSLGAAEAYIQGDWSCDDLVALLRMFARDLAVTDAMETGGARLAGWLARAAHWLHRNTHRGSAQNIRAHYDLGNEFFAAFLDPGMTYSCGVFERPDSILEEASAAKLDRICRKLRLTPEDHLVEIGTG